MWFYFQSTVDQQVHEYNSTKYKIIQCLMTGKLNKQAELSMVSNAIQSKAHIKNDESTLVQHSDVDPLLARHIKAKSRPGSHRALHKL